jgi:hypothetical protein
MNLMLPLSPYPHVYLIVKLLLILRLSGLKIVLSLIDVSLAPLHLLHESQTSLLFIKYYNKTNVLLHTILVSTSIPNHLEIFHP